MGEASKEQVGWSYIVRCEFIREVGRPSKGDGQDKVKRNVMFRLAKDAGQYLLGLILSSTLGSLVFDACTPQEAFFKVSHHLAISNRIKVTGALSVRSMRPAIQILEPITIPIPLSCPHPLSIPIFKIWRIMGVYKV